MRAYRSKTGQIDEPMDVLRPFAWIFAVFFATGFWGYVALNPPS